jgi:hypothetical protein
VKRCIPVILVIISGNISDHFSIFLTLSNIGDEEEGSDTVYVCKVLILMTSVPDP